ncbi:MAG: tRNA (adenosine(37)-N6)-threonylcarbamoyltransferase complex dimerization subunit type 1 TsaB [Methyloceanibacter sp.]
MNILALDTSMGACSAAMLAVDGAARTLVLREALMARGHAEALMPMVAEVMQERGTAFADLDLIAATVGPGSFTGVRITIAAARGLALVTRAKLFGTDSLSVMARSALASGEVGATPFAVAVDARRGMLYLGLYDEAARKLEGPLLIAPDEALHLLPPNPRVAVGSGAELLAAAGAQQGRLIEARLPELQPSAGALAEIAYASGETVPTLKPLYLRPPDARPQAQAVSRR